MDFFALTGCEHGNLVSEQRAERSVAGLMTGKGLIMCWFVLAGILV